MLQRVTVYCLLSMIGIRRGGVMARSGDLGWDLESLNKAYQHGYMAASVHMEPSRCPYRTEGVQAAWEAGWEDGHRACTMKSGRSTSRNGPEASGLSWLLSSLSA